MYKLNSPGLLCCIRTVYISKEEELVHLVRVKHFLKGKTYHSTSLSLQYWFCIRTSYVALYSYSIGNVYITDSHIHASHDECRNMIIYNSCVGPHWYLTPIKPSLVYAHGPCPFQQKGCTQGVWPLLKRSVHDLYACKILTHFCLAIPGDPGGYGGWGG